ncbi:hypothetical protein KBD61_06105 [Patescibacteria group bacterium]|nr:hypothetical protein [Patescibacteria group bacterium]
MASQPVMSNKSGICSRFCCGTHSVAWCVLKVVVALFVLCAVFCLGARMGVRRSSMMKQGMMGSDSMMYMRGMGDEMMRGERGVMGMKVMKMEHMRGMDMMANGNASGTTSVFGSISKIENNKFTVKDNGAVDHIVVSESTTTIMSSTGETSLASLKVGQTVEVHGMMAENGALTAKMVRVFP